MTTYSRSMLKRIATQLNSEISPNAPLAYLRGQMTRVTKGEVDPKTITEVAELVAPHRRNDNDRMHALEDDMSTEMLARVSAGATEQDKGEKA